MQRINHLMSRPLGLLAALALASGAVLGWNLTRVDDGAEPAPPARALGSGGVLEVLSARPFRLEEAYRHDYRSERPLVTEGWLLALKVDPRLATLREGFMPVLYGAGETMERMNPGKDGVIVTVLPASIDRPIAGERFWFGDAELPERVDAFTVQRQTDRAVEAGIPGLSAAQWNSARTSGGEVLELPARIDLEEAAARLVLELAPGDRSWAKSILIPR